ncbi:hypothetical protein ACFLR4_02535 [Bacteroidota bacterium]
MFRTAESGRNLSRQPRIANLTTSKNLWKEEETALFFVKILKMINAAIAGRLFMECGNDDEYYYA